MHPQDILKYGHLTVVRTLDEFPKDQVYTTGACGWWSVRDLIAHLSSFELMLVDVLSSQLSAGPTPYLDAYTNRSVNFNDDQVGRRQDFSMEEAYEEYCLANDRVMELAREIPQSTWQQRGVLPWYGREYDLEDFIVYTFYGHKREHCGQIAVFRDRFV